MIDLARFHELNVGDFVSCYAQQWGVGIILEMNEFNVFVDFYSHQKWVSIFHVYKHEN